MHIGEVAGIVAGGIAQRAFGDVLRYKFGFRVVLCPGAFVAANVNREAPDAQVWREQTSIRGYSVARRGRAEATEW